MPFGLVTLGGQISEAWIPGEVATESWKLLRTLLVRKEGLWSGGGCVDCAMVDLVAC